MYRAARSQMAEERDEDARMAVFRRVGDEITDWTDERFGEAE